MLTGLRSQGWIVIEDAQLVEATLTELGTIVEDRLLEARSQHFSRAGTFSAMYGTAAFPWHSDGAHWPLPPRYLALCAVGPAVGSTLIVSSTRLLEAIPAPARRRVGHATWSTKTRRGSFYSSIISQRNGRTLYRYDPLCMVPRNRDAILVREAISAVGPDIADVRHDWRGGEMLIVDNWTHLHARSAVTSGRRMRRVYVNDGKCS